ncbi:hypothetical protein JEQ12_015136 [Ovis aries]|uniref:ER lumen protein-retaining receptor n=1 Tax=Ovis aries TaxID=9940 RepID=A0A836D8F0_SHEEP|nr:hypothetical protein JEQ12_015136 [Ovis aries]
MSMGCPFTQRSKERFLGDVDLVNVTGNKDSRDPGDLGAEDVINLTQKAGVTSSGPWQKPRPRCFRRRRIEDKTHQIPGNRLTALNARLAAGTQELYDTALVTSGETEVCGLALGGQELLSARMKQLRPREGKSLSTLAGTEAHLTPNQRVFGYCYPTGQVRTRWLLKRTGISGKSQILFALVFTTRYLDLFTNFISIYNTVMKMVFLLCAYVTVYMIYGKFRKTFDSENDTFRLEFLLVPVIGLSFLENYSFTPLEILWTFSIYLESVAILPQLFMISKTGEAETITTHYLFFLGLYRALYLANWIRRYQTENFYDQIAVVSGVVQTIFYCDFFYLYVTKENTRTEISFQAHLL